MNVIDNVGSGTDFVYRPMSGSMSEHYIIAMGSGSLLDKKARE